MDRHLTEPRTFLYAVLMWQSMMMAMMAPVLYRWIAVLTRLTNHDPRLMARVRSGAGFVGGYFSVWLLFSVAASAVQLWLQQAGLLDHHQRIGAAVGGSVLMLAGVVQLTPLKRACLAHCRNPLGYFLTRWRNGPMSGVHLGFGHGTYCLGCCWALMATAFALGLMNLAWMATLTAISCIEQLVPHGDRVGRILGGVLAGWGLLVMFGR